MDTTQLAFGLLSTWSRGEDAHAFVLCEPGISHRHKVRGLDQDGLLKEPNVALRAYDVLTDPTVAGEWIAVRGDDPECCATRFFRDISSVGESFVVVTPSRLAVARLRDAQSETDAALSELTADVTSQKSVGGLMRGVGRLVKGAATEMAKSVRRPPLTERPEDASITVGSEVPRQELAGIERWKQPMVPDLKHGPRMVQIHFTDGSWTRVQTTVEGAQSLIGMPS